VAETNLPEPPWSGDDDWEHIEAAKKIDAIFANQVFVQPLGDGLLRLNFGEVLDDQPRYHSAIVISARNGLALADLIDRIARATLTPGTQFTSTATVQNTTVHTENG
jgi:hypothetical protein